jgi:hypothetical protein
MYLVTQLIKVPVEAIPQQIVHSVAVCCVGLLGVLLRSTVWLLSPQQHHPTQPTAAAAAPAAATPTISIFRCQSAAGT